MADFDRSLRFCPFCGEEPYLRDDAFSRVGYVIGCMTEDCIVGDWQWFATEEEAIKYWNTEDGRE